MDEINWSEFDGVFYGSHSIDNEPSWEIHLNMETDLYSAERQPTHVINRIPFSIKPSANLEEIKDAISTYFSNHDSLTNTYNRSYLETIYRSEISKAQSTPHNFSILLIGIDNMFQYNKICGHNQGDLSIITIASILQSCVRPNDTLVRYGGDEYFIVLPDTDLQEAEAISLKLKDAVNSFPFKDSGFEQWLSISVAYACSQELESFEDPYPLIRLVDDRMERIKNKLKYGVEH